MDHGAQGAQGTINPGSERNTQPDLDSHLDYSHPTSTQSPIDDDREATELGPVDSESHQPTQNQPNGQPQRQIHWYHDIQAFWKNYIYLAVPHATCRDHLANERTFLAYQRTSLALSMIGIVTAQLFDLQRSTSSHPELGYFALGKPLAALFQITAMMVTVIGAHRFWRQQMNMSRGKVWAGGWEIYAIMAAMLLLVVLIFSLLIVVDIAEES